MLNGALTGALLLRRSAALHGLLRTAVGGAIPHVIPDASQEWHPQHALQVLAFELLGAGQCGVEHVIVGEGQADVLGLQPDIERTRCDGSSCREPHRGHQEGHCCAERDQLVPQDPFGDLLGQPRGSEQRCAHAELETGDNMVVGHLLGREAHQVADVLPVELELLQLVVEARKDTLHLLALVIEEVGSVVVKQGGGLPSHGC
mmetsp:Transcript_92081/g.237605  ORF Transcript_92081/g.237605 Transcript_92081/m.237605 type:complete len:203 (+) Transcript_92081:2439-3047(+)